MFPGVFGRLFSQRREAALVFGRWTTSSGVTTKVAGSHNNLEVTNTGTGTYRLDVTGGCTGMSVMKVRVYPATPGTRANHRDVIEGVPVVSTATATMAFQTFLNATEAVAASASNPQDGSTIEVICWLSK
jgi:hypothetical protein